MKRFLLFAGEVYYGRGGMNDFIQSFDTLIQAMDVGFEHIERKPDMLWFHVYDAQLGKVVFRSDTEPHGCPVTHNDPEHAWDFVT